MNKKLVAAVSAASALYFGIPSVAASAGWAPSALPSSDLNVVIQGILNMLLFIIVIAAVVFISLAGLKYISSQGDAGKAKEAQAAITNAVIGLVVAFAAYFIVTFVLGRLGIDQNQFNSISEVVRSVLVA